MQMFKRAFAIWISVLFTAVPYAVYYLFFEASREDYALLITFVLFWIFGFWGVVAPLLSLIRIRQIFKLLETARSPEAWLAILRRPDAQETAIDLIASESGLPHFAAKRIFNLLAKHFTALAAKSKTPDKH